MTQHEIQQHAHSLRCTAGSAAQLLPDTWAPACTVIGVADRSGGIINENGLDVPALRHHVKAKPPFGGNLRTFPGGVLSRCV